MVLAGIVIPCAAVFAQPGPPPGTPIDGGLGLLLAAGGLYGYKKLKKAKKES